MLTWPVTALGWVTSIIQRAAASQKRINEFLNTKNDIVSEKNIEKEISGQLEFQHVNFIYEDLQSNLWLTLNNGLSRVDLNSPFTLINERMDISGSGYTALKAPEGTSLGTNNGLYLFKNEIFLILLLSSVKNTSASINKSSKHLP